MLNVLFQSAFMLQVWHSSIHTHVYTGGSNYLTRCLLIRSVKNSHTHTLMEQHQDQFGIRYLAQAHFDMLTVGSDIKPGNLWSLDNSSTIWATAAAEPTGPIYRFGSMKLEEFNFILKRCNLDAGQTTQLDWTSCSSITLTGTLQVIVKMSIVKHNLLSKYCMIILSKEKYKVWPHCALILVCYSHLSEYVAKEIYFLHEKDIYYIN